MLPTLPPSTVDRTVTYSPAYTLVPTYECFNRCSYCNFRVNPGQDTWLSLPDAAQRLQALSHRGVIEILVLSGEVHPQSSRRQAWFQHIFELCQLAFQAGFLPHTNAGPLSFEEMAQLKLVNVSMGLMVEQVTPALLETVHRHAPSKVPSVRLQQIAWAGELRIPFTTGLLLGIGETPDDWVETLDAIANLHHTYGHIQEVILQPHSPGQSQAHLGQPFPPEQLIQVVQLARQHLPANITLQIPPNLVDDDTLMACLEAGVRDLGGIGPTDEVNPDYPHPTATTLAERIQPQWHLSPRLPVYPQYDAWLPTPLRERVQHWRRQLSGLHTPPEISTRSR
ncbi:MAG TPA: 7,8-didemethyl-8-hydroxy-5-deazariboflavin synthase subunit CofG [Leptolyngbyaceae cyanobacterium]